MKTIVISGVNLVEAGTLAILRDCLAYLSMLAEKGEYRVIAIVYKRELADFPNIEYIETQWPKKRWINRLWYEYVSMKKLSQEIGPVYLWFSLHDTSPSVHAKRRAVYCHNSFSFYKWNLRDVIFAPKIAAFAIFTKYIYRTNIHRNKYVVVQQEWFRNAMSRQFNIPKQRIIVSPPKLSTMEMGAPSAKKPAVYSFIFAGSPNSHKNFECICEAAALLESNYGMKDFVVYITVKGDENKYAQWLYDKWANKTTSLNFIGFIPIDTLYDYYDQCHCLIFPSKIESWGLPISEFKAFNKPMLLADLPYAHETAAGAEHVSFFNPDHPQELGTLMKKLIVGQTDFLHEVKPVEIEQPLAENWEELFDVLLKDELPTKTSM